MTLNGLRTAVLIWAGSVAFWAVLVVLLVWRAS
jgi:hypothetical protein